MRELKQLSHVHQAIAEMVLAGATNREIANAMGKTDMTVSIIIRSPLFQDYVARRRASQQQTIDGVAASTINQAKITLENSAQQAADKLKSLMTDSPDQKVQQTSAVEILKRTYDRDFGRADVSHGGTFNFHLSEGALLNLQIALDESKALSILPTQAEPLPSGSTEGEPSVEKGLISSTSPSSPLVGPLLESEAA